MIRFTSFLIAVAIGLLTSGCASTHMGKIDFSDGNVPSFLKVGETTEHEVLEKIGEPVGYRANGDQSNMMFVSYDEYYIFFLVGDFRKEEAHRMDLVFVEGVLTKADIKREGMGRGVNVDDFVYRSYLF